MKLLSPLFGLSLLIGTTLGNTESKQLKTELNAYPQCSYNVSSYRISLKNTNYAKETFDIPLYPSEDSYSKWTLIDINDIQGGESYLVKISWSALYPVSIEHDIITKIDSSTYNEISTTFDSDIGSCNKHYIRVLLRNDSYPILNHSTKIPVNFIVVNTKLGIPVDLFGILIYIIAMMIGIGILDRKIGLYRMLTN